MATTSCFLSKLYQMDDQDSKTSSRSGIRHGARQLQDTLLEFIVGRHEVFAVFLQGRVWVGSAHFAMSRQLITDTPSARMKSYLHKSARAEVLLKRQIFRLLSLHEYSHR